MRYINQRDYPDMPYPNYSEEYNKVELKEKVDSSHALLLYCDADLLEPETENREIPYYLFEIA